MKVLYRFFDKRIVEGKGFLAFTIIFALFVRILYILSPTITSTPNAVEGYLWNLLIPLFSNSIASLIIESLLLAVIALMSYFLIVRHTLIRRKTLLPIAFTILLFSCSPIYMPISPVYIGVLTILIIANDLFIGYTSILKQTTAMKVAFHLSLGSLFAPYLLAYLPILWYCLSKIRGTDFKSFFAFTFGIILVYVPATSLFFITGQLESFLKPFVSLSSIEWNDFPLLSYDLVGYVLFSITIILFLIVLIDNHIYRHKDKVSTRIFLRMLTLITFFSLACGFFINLDSLLFLSIAIGIGAIQLGHFFSLTEHRPLIMLFFVLLITFFIFSLSSFV